VLDLLPAQQLQRQALIADATLDMAEAGKPSATTEELLQAHLVSKVRLDVSSHFVCRTARSSRQHIFAIVRKGRPLHQIASR